MIIQEIGELSTWNVFFDQNGSPSFLQSWEWGEFEEKMGYRVTRLGVYKKNELAGIAQVIHMKTRRGSFLFIPHGPIMNVERGTWNVERIIKALQEYLIDLAKKENCSFIRIAPILENMPENQKIFADLGFKKAPIYMHAERLWVLPLYHLDIDRSKMVINDEEILSKMRKTTRYLIRKAQREGVIIEKRTDEMAVDDFYKIYEQTAARENFVPFSKAFIREEFNAFNKTGNALFLFGKVHPAGGIASALIIFTKSTGFYHQGASIHTKIPVTYLLQWEAIKEARRRGCQFYNFWGIQQEGRTPKSWSGLTLFKQGFGGQQIDYLPTQDLVLSPKYYLIYLYERLLAWRRGV